MNGVVLKTGNKTFHFGDTVDVFCNLGYVLGANGTGNEFNKTLTCLATGSWDDVLPNCTSMNDICYNIRLSCFNAMTKFYRKFACTPLSKN